VKVIVINHLWKSVKNFINVQGKFRLVHLLEEKITSK